MIRAAHPLLWLLVVCSLAESVSRVLFRMPEVPAFNRLRYMPVEPAANQARAVRSIRVVKESAPDGVAVEQTLNEYGFRGPLRLVRTAGQVRVVFIGDSFVEGVFVPDDQTIPRVFEARAVEKGVRVEAVNLGVAGSGFEWYPSLVLDAATLLKPDGVILVVYANDLPASPPLPAPRSLRRRPAAEPWLFSLIGMAWRREQLPYRWSWRRVSFDRPVPDPSNPWSDPEFQERFRASVTPRFLAAMREARFFPLRIGGSLYLEEALRTPFDLRPALSHLRDSVRRLGSRLYLVYLPERGAVTNYYRSFEREFSIGFPEQIDLTEAPYQLHRLLLREQCADLGIPFLDLYDLVEAQEREGRHLFLTYDDHLAAAGARVIGSRIFDWWASL